jgi:hypothetical protein
VIAQTLDDFEDVRGREDRPSTGHEARRQRAPASCASRAPGHKRKSRSPPQRCRPKIFVDERNFWSSIVGPLAGRTSRARPLRGPSKARTRCSRYM